jgi:hypothetical protein
MKNVIKVRIAEENHQQKRNTFSNVQFLHIRFMKVWYGVVVELFSSTVGLRQTLVHLRGEIKLIYLLCIVCGDISFGIIEL